MNNLIYIDPYIYWTVVVLLFFLIFMNIIAFSLLEDKKSRICNLKEENNRLKKRNEYLREQLSVTQQDLYRYTYKLPEVDEPEE